MYVIQLYKYARVYTVQCGHAMAARLRASMPRVLGQHAADFVAFGRLVLLSACISIRICNRLFRVTVEVVGFRFLFLSEQLGFVSCYKTRTTDQ